MTANDPPKIDISEKFHHLSRPPIVEAIIGITARPSQALEEGPLTAFVSSTLPDYPKKEATRNLHHEIKLTESKPEHISREGWRGVNCTSADGKQIAQFNSDGLVFSRLPPYEDWESLNFEMFRLWDIYCTIAKPLEVQRLGVRFINRIMFPLTGTSMSEVLVHPPKSPFGPKTPIFGFFHQETFSLPRTDYAVQLTKTIQPAQDAVTKELAMSLIVDIDAFTTRPFELEVGALTKHLEQTRWLKNKAFFGSLTPQILETFK